MLLLRREEISLKTNTEKEYFIAGLWKLEVLGSGIVCLNSNSVVGASLKKPCTPNEIYTFGIMHKSFL